MNNVQESMDVACEVQSEWTEKSKKLRIVADDVVKLFEQNNLKHCEAEDVLYTVRTLLVHSPVKFVSGC